MTRLTITLPEETAEALRREAVRRRVPVSGLARQAIEEKLGICGEKRALPFRSLGRSRRSDISSNLDAELARTWADAIAGDR